MTLQEIQHHLGYCDVAHQDMLQDNSKPKRWYDVEKSKAGNQYGVHICLYKDIKQMFESRLAQQKVEY